MTETRTPTPEVGMAATVIYWTDRAAATIVEVSPNGRTVKVTHDKATRTDTNGMSESQEYDYETDWLGPRTAYTLRKNGRWVRRGDSMNGQGLAIGYRRTYHDYSF
jgi:hypothetical protein